MNCRASESRAELAPAMPSAAEIAVRKYFACASNDFRDRFRPVGKSSRKIALFYCGITFCPNSTPLSWKILCFT